MADAAKARKLWGGRELKCGVFSGEVKGTISIISFPQAAVSVPTGCQTCPDATFLGG
jgi:hypothetical protein